MLTSLQKIRETTVLGRDMLGPWLTKNLLLNYQGDGGWEELANWKVDSF